MYDDCSDTCHCMTKSLHGILLASCYRKDADSGFKPRSLRMGVEHPYHYIPSQVFNTPIYAPEWWWWWLSTEITISFNCIVLSPQHMQDRWICGQFQSRNSWSRNLMRFVTLPHCCFLSGLNSLGSKSNWHSLVWGSACVLMSLNEHMLNHKSVLSRYRVPWLLPEPSSIVDCTLVWGSWGLW